MALSNYLGLASPSQPRVPFPRISRENKFSVAHMYHGLKDQIPLLQEHLPPFLFGWLEYLNVRKSVKIQSWPLEVSEAPGAGTGGVYLLGGLWPREPQADCLEELSKDKHIQGDASTEEGETIPLLQPPVCEH